VTRPPAVRRARSSPFCDCPPPPTFPISPLPSRRTASLFARPDAARGARHRARSARSSRGCRSGPPRVTWRRKLSQASCRPGLARRRPRTGAARGGSAWQSRVSRRCRRSRRAAGSVPPPSFPRTKWTRRVPHPVLIGHAASLSQVRWPAGSRAEARSLPARAAAPHARRAARQPRRARLARAHGAPPPLPRTNRISLVPPLVLSGHAVSLTGAHGGGGRGGWCVADDAGPRADADPRARVLPLWGERCPAAAARLRARRARAARKVAGRAAPAKGRLDRAEPRVVGRARGGGGRAAGAHVGRLAKEPPPPPLVLSGHAASLTPY